MKAITFAKRAENGTHHVTAQSGIDGEQVEGYMCCLQEGATLIISDELFDHGKQIAYLLKAFSKTIDMTDDKFAEKLGVKLADLLSLPKASDGLYYTTDGYKSNAGLARFILSALCEPIK